MKCPLETTAEKSCCCGSQARANLSGADDEDSRSDFEGDVGQAEVVGSGRDHWRKRPDDAALATEVSGTWLHGIVGSAEAGAESEAGASGGVGTSAAIVP